jgi:hypothetical protein
VTIGLGAFRAATNALTVQQQRLQSREDQQENSTRDARNAYTFSTTGVGGTISGRVDFDCTYIQEPHVTSGLVLVRPPDQSLYQMPLGQVGIYSWIKTAQKPAGDVSDDDVTQYNPLLDSEPDDTVPMFYTGAFLYFQVTVPPRAGVTITQQNNAPPLTILQHHLVFQGIAMKKLSTAIESSKNTSVVVPRTTNLVSS